MHVILPRTILERLGPTPDLISIANALVLKNPPLDSIRTKGMPNFVQVMHHNLREQIGKTVMLPNLHDSKFVGIFSDYGGEEKDSDYFTYSFLFVSLDVAKPCLDALEQIRARHGLLSPRREMSFKELRYGTLGQANGPLARALPEWLNAIDSLTGMLFTLMVDKTAESIITRNSNEALKTLANGMLADKLVKWRNWDDSERFLRIAHCIAYWCSVLCRDGQQIIWVTDNDKIAANPEIKDNLIQVTLSAAAQYRENLRVNYSIGPDDELREKHGNFRDFLSYPDLVAGSVGHGMTRAIARGPIPGSHPIPGGEATKTKAVQILRWLAGQRITLKRVVFLARPHGEMIGGEFGSLDHDVIPDDMHFVPITPE